jgi:hypothetical protein
MGKHSTDQVGGSAAGGDRLVRGQSATEGGQHRPEAVADRLRREAVDEASGTSDGR